jgi:hypothetical protein
VERPLLTLPRGTRILPDECGFALPDGRYLRLYAHGIQEELPDGRPVGFDVTERRPPFTAFRFRVGEGPWASGTLEPVAYRIGHEVELVLPDTLETFDDRALVELCGLIMRRVVELEIAFELCGYRARRLAGGRPAVVHVIDMAGADPLGEVAVG